MVPSEYVGLCTGSPGIEYAIAPNTKHIYIRGVPSSDATLEGWAGRYLLAPAADGVDIPFQNLPTVSLKFMEFNGIWGVLDCKMPQAVAPSPTDPAATPIPTESATATPKRGQLSVVKLTGYECYTGDSAAYWDDTRVVLTLRIKNVDKTKSLKIFLKVSTARGGPLNKFRAISRLKNGKSLGQYGENAPTELTFEGDPLAPGKEVLLKWSADYFWAPYAVQVEVWNGVPGEGEGQQDVATYSLSSQSPPGLKSCARY
jgi:hypothetical protein